MDKLFIYYIFYISRHLKTFSFTKNSKFLEENIQKSRQTLAMYCPKLRDNEARKEKIGKLPKILEQRRPSLQFDCAEVPLLKQRTRIKKMQDKFSSHKKEDFSNFVSNEILTSKEKGVGPNSCFMKEPGKNIFPLTDEKEPNPLNKALSRLKLFKAEEAPIKNHNVQLSKPVPAFSPVIEHNSLFTPKMEIGTIKEEDEEEKVKAATPTSSSAIVQNSGEEFCSLAKHRRIQQLRRKSRLQALNSNFQDKNINSLLPENKKEEIDILDKLRNISRNAYLIELKGNNSSVTQLMKLEEQVKEIRNKHRSCKQIDVLVKKLLENIDTKIKTVMKMNSLLLKIEPTFKGSSFNQSQSLRKQLIFLGNNF